MGFWQRVTTLCVGALLVIGAVSCGPSPQPASPTTGILTPATSTGAAVPTVVPPGPTSIAGPSPSAPAEGTPTPAWAIPTPGAGQAGRFATYRPISSDVTPRVKPYSVDADLGNVEIAEQYQLSPEARALLAKNAFVVTPGDYKEFFHLYEQLSYEHLPAFITTDSVLHIYHLLFDKILRDTERESLSSAAVSLTTAMLEASLSQYDAAKGSALESAAKRNVAFFAVAASLLKAPVAMPSIVKDKVQAELKLIEAHAGPAESPIFGYQEDYSQYTVRGHYTKSETLTNYFKAMMWYGRMAFLLKGPAGQPEVGRDQTRSALLVVSALRTAKGGAALATWEKVYQPTAFFVGVSDDLTVQEYGQLAETVFGGVDRIEALADEAKLDLFIDQAFDLRPPQINSMVLTGAEDRDEATIGMRFMGQRFVLDAAIFQRLIEREVPGRMLPRALDVFAGMGSEQAYSILKNEGENKYPKYDEQMAKVRNAIRPLGLETWTQNLYWSWLYTLQALLQEKGEGYPTFMRSEAWARKDLNTGLGSWTELKHDTILYAKQSYAERGDGAAQIPHGYVEPNPELYGRLAALTQMTLDGLQGRGLLPDTDAGLLIDLLQVLERLKQIAERELAGEDLTKEDDRWIEEFGAKLERLTMAAADPVDPTAPPGRSYIESLDAAVVADVSTAPGKVLEVGVGRVFPIYVVVPVDGRLQVNKGGVFSHYEFVQPQSDRLTDEAWRAQLERQAPPLPKWTESFIAR